MRPEKLTLTLPVLYGQQEMDEIRDRLSASILEYEDTEDRKSSAASNHNDRLKALRGEMRALSIKIRNKGEDRPVECRVAYHRPSEGLKSIFRTDLNELVKIEQMSFEERQESLFADEVTELEDLYKSPADDDKPVEADPPTPPAPDGKSQAAGE